MYVNTPTTYYAMTMANGTAYVGCAGQTCMGKYVNVSCVENWLPADTTCSGGYSTRLYSDNSSCGTTDYVPPDNGTIQRCNYNYVLDTWYDLSTTDRYPEYGWITGAAIPIGKYNGNIYYSISATTGAYIAKYDPITNILSQVSTVSWCGVNPLMVDDLIYCNPTYSVLAPVRFTVYNITSNTFTDLTDSDNATGNWAGTFNIQSFAKMHNLIFTRVAGTGMFGVYNTTDGIWYYLPLTNISITQYGLSNGGNFMIADESTDILYLGLGAFSAPPYITTFGIYNVTSGNYSVVSPPFYNSTVGISTMIGLQLVNDTIYGGIGNGNYPAPNFFAFNTTSRTWRDLSNTTVNNWANNTWFSGNSGNGALQYDDTNGVLYTSMGGNPIKFGVYVIANNTWYNHSVLGGTSIDDELVTSWFGLYMDTLTQILYAGDTDGTHLYKTPYGNGTCFEHWVQDSYTCYGVYNYTKTYTDYNSCGTNNTLPVDNGTIVSCPILYPNVTSFNGVTSNFSNLSIAQLMNYSGLILENTSNGKIEWNGITKVYGANFDSYIRLLPNLVSVNASALDTTINTSTNISIYNIFIVSPWVFRDGVRCTNCSILSNNGSTIIFTAPSFSNYTLGNCSENWTYTPPSCYNLFNYTINYNDTNSCGTNYTLPANNGTLVTCNISYPNATNFNGVTSYFNDKTQAGLETFYGLILENTSNGKIEWNGVTNVSAQNFDAYITISHNYINVNSGALNPSINSPANISLYNLSIASPWVYKDGAYCPSCNILSNNGSTIKFYAPSFSNYTIGNCSEVWVQQPPMTCTGLNSNYTIRYNDSNSCGTTYSLPANNGTLVTCVLITYSGGTTPSYTSSSSGRVNVSTNANYTIIKIYNATGGVVASNLLTSTLSNFTNSSAGLFDPSHPASYGFDNNYSTYAQPNATGYATIYINQTIPYMATRLSQWNLVTYSNTGPGIDVNVTIPDDCWTYPTLQLAVEMYNDVGIHYVYPQCYNGTAWNILTIDQNSNHSGLYEESMIWILANGTDYTNTNMTEGTFYYNATGYPVSGQPVSTATQNFTIITRFHNESYNTSFPYPNNGFTKNNNLTYGVTTTDPYYNYSTYTIQGLNGIDTGACYQENANDPVDCGGALGSYSCILSNGSNCDTSLAHDSNWGTYFSPNNGTYLYTNWSYNAGLSVNNATWYYKDNSPAYNYSTLIPPTCIMNPIQLRIQFIMLGAPTFNYWGNLTCKNSTGSWMNFYTAPNGPYNGTIRGLILYEDAMQWQFSGGIIDDATYSRVLPDGKYYYAMTVYDKAGNNQYYDPNITIDTTLPVVTYLAGTQADNSYIGFNKTNFTVNISSTDTYLNMTTIWLYKAGVVVDSYALYNTTLMNKTFTGLTNGIYKFNVTATDEATNIGTTATRTVTIIDSFQNGLYTVTYNYPNDYVSNVSTNNLINFTTTDPNYAYTIYNVSGTITNTTAQGFTPTLTEGVYNYNVRIYDLAGNNYQYPTQNITVDGTNPVINYIGITPANNAYIGNNQSNITVNIQVTDMHLNSSTNIIYLYDNASNLLSQVNDTNLTTFTGLTAGVYKFNATSIDTFGNKGVGATRTVTLVPFFNTSAYNVLFNYNSTDIITSATFNATSFTTTDPYYSTVTYGIQLLPSGYSGSESTSRKFKNWTIPVDGQYHNYLTIYDLAGNSQYYDQNITVSAGIPTLSYAADTQPDLSYKNQPYIYVHILPNATNATNMTTIIYLYNSSMAIIATANNTNTSNFTGLSDGVYYFNALASNLGYNTTALTRTVTIHQTFSIGLYNVTYPYVNNTLTSNNSITIRFNTTDPYYDYATYNAGGSYVNSTLKTYTIVVGDGTSTYGIQIFDKAGNSNIYPPNTIRVDTTPPIISYYAGTPANNSVINYNIAGQGAIIQAANVYDANYNKTMFRLYNSIGGLINVLTDTSYPTPFQIFYPYPDGVYSFEGTAYDNLGFSTATGRRTVTIHLNFTTALYNATFPYPNEKYLNSSNLTYGFTSTDPYYSYAVYDVNGLNIAYSNSTTTTNKSATFILPDGKYYYATTIYDQAGNFHYYDPNITIDTTPPIVNFTINSDGSYVYMRPYLYLQTQANDTNLNYTIIRVYNSTGGLLANYSGNTSITTFTTGNFTDAFYYVNATAYDLAGNPGYSATYQIEIDYIKNAVQFYASEKVTDNHLYYNITFNSTGNNFQTSSVGLSKSRTVNAIPWNIYNITITETVNGSYYTCNYYNWNATNNYVFPNCALYNSLDYLNLTHSYLGTAINNYNVTIVNTANAFIEIDSNVSNYSIGLIKGLNYTIYFDQIAFFSTSTNYTPISATEILSKQMNNTQITLVFKSAFSGAVLNGTNITINDTSIPGKIFTTNTGSILFNPNSGLKNFTMQPSGDIIAQPVTLTFTDREISSRDVLLYPILNVSVYDEKASLLNETFFNFSRPTEAKYTLYCYYPQNYTISGTILNTTFGAFNIPTPCIFDRIRFDLVYTNIDASTFSYYRTITFAPTTTNFNFKVYLADHTTTDTLQTALKPYDIFGIYTVDQHTQIQVKEIFPSGTQLVTSDYMDSEGKVTVTLMTAGQYIITVLADDAPIRTLGPYYADTGGTKILRLFDVTLTGPENEQTSVIAETSILENDSIQMLFYDKTATTKLLSLNAYDCGCDDPTIVNKTPIMTGTYTQAQLAISGYAVVMTTNVNGTHYMNKTSNKLFCTTYNRTDTSNRVQVSFVPVTWDFIKRLPAQFKNPWSLPWIIMLLFVIIALGATTRTAAPVSLLLALMASLLYAWEWFVAPAGGIPGILPHATLGFAIILALFFNFKRVA
jgi:hypothetical protein